MRRITRSQFHEALGSTARLRKMKGQHRATLEASLLPLLDLLANDGPIPERHRDCHVKPDLVLIYAKPEDDTLRLVRLGSHAEVFG